MSETCFSCGCSSEIHDGPIHEYMLSSPGCWHQYGEILAREYQNPVLFNQSHRLTVDAYALQHPGKLDDRRAVQSVWIHFMSIHMIFELGYSHFQARAALGKMAGKTFDKLPAIQADYAITARDVWDAGEMHHSALVVSWAQCAYEAWKVLLPKTRAALVDL